MWILKRLPATYLTLLVQISRFIFGFSDEYSCPEAVFQVVSTEGTVQCVNNFKEFSTHHVVYTHCFVMLCAQVNV